MVTQLVLGCDQEVAAWVANQLDAKPPGPCTAIGIANETRLIAGFVFWGYTGRDVVLTVAATTPRWAQRRYLQVIGDYVFRQLGCARITAIISKKNKRARRVAEGLGFQVEGRLRRYAKDGDAIVYGMLLEEWRMAHGLVTVAA